jgi:glycosyltransferase involved in cell wall biosynthesis
MPEINWGIDAEKVVLCPRGYKIENDYLNNDIIIQAAKKVIKQDNKVLFLFLGIHINSDWETFYHNKENEPFNDYFRNDGSVKFDLMPLYYSSADVVVSISSNDSQPNCMLEAMACKTPVIMGDIPQIKEWVSDGVNGFLVPCRDQNLLSQTITEVLNMDDNRSSKITSKAYEQLKEKAEMNKNSNLVKELVKSL